MAAMVAILDFRLERFYIFLIYKSPRRFLTSFKSIGLFVQEEKWKIDSQNGRHGGHLGFSIGLILAIFDLQFTPMRPTKFQVNWPFGSGGEVKNRFSRWPHSGHLGFLIGMILAIFYLQVTLMLTTKFQVNWPFGSGGEDKKYFLPSFESIDLWVRIGRGGGHLGFLIETILSIFD